ncbi:hypothetical protein BV133_2719 [Blastochloris viridis]|uniref:Uncharacterized protein n=1 Tax=Blastochloris viridis TaxID=1079 RepID=A0A182D696_BLAVI|nr:hypothetical protein BV133_2719 [Blastochloris viridis]
MKDRVSALAVARAAGASVVTPASTGNAATALPRLCAAEGMTAVIFGSAAIPEAKSDGNS